MSIAGFMWECKCGYVDCGEEEPEECPDCMGLDSFTKLPEELIDEREKDMSEDLDLMSLRKNKLKRIKLKSKTKKGGNKNEIKKKKKSR